MEIPAHIKQLASLEGCPDVKYLGKWKEYDVYSAFDKEFPFVGLPQYIIAEATTNEQKARFATVEETEEIMSSAV